jgi:hypothetical protein
MTTFYLEVGAVPGPGALVAAVEKAVAEQDKVAGAGSFPGDLVQLPLLHQLPARPDQFPVTQPGLQPQHPLELILREVSVLSSWWSL